MEISSEWVIIRDTNGGLQLKPTGNPEGNQVVEEFETYEEAKIAFNFYLHLLIPKFGQNMNF